MKLLITTMALSLCITLTASAKCKAVLVNGGGNRSENYSIHETQLREMYNSLRAHGCRDEDIHVFSASGNRQSKDFRVNPMGSESDFTSYAYNYNGGKPIKNLYASDKEMLKKKIAEISKSASPQDQMFIYMSDHGYDSGTKKGLVPWTEDVEDVFTEKDLEAALTQAPLDTRINIWADCCYCGVFNKIKRANTCIATSTDEYHPGNYFWSKNIMTDPANATVEARFAGALRHAKKPTLGHAAQLASLTFSDSSYLAGNLGLGCFLGPRNSAEQYAFEVIGYGDKKICAEDLDKFYKAAPTKNGSAPICEESPGLFPELENFKRISESLTAAAKQSSAKSKARIKELADEMKQALRNIEESPEVRRIQQISLKFSEQSSENQSINSYEYQAEAFQLQLQMLKKHKIYEIFARNQKLIVDEIFHSTANTEQKAEYERRKACLKESLF